MSKERIKIVLVCNKDVRYQGKVDFMFSLNRTSGVRPTESLYLALLTLLQDK